MTFPHAAATTQHHANHTKDSSENKKTDLHKQQELHQKKLQQEDIALRAKLEQELALVARLLHEEHHRHRHHHAMKKDNTSTPAQLQNGIQQPTNGQQRPSQQQNGSTGEQDSSQPQVAQEQTTPGTDPQHGTASNAMEYAEKLLLAAIHRLEEVLSQGRVHRHHQTAEAQPLLGEDVRAIESAMSVMRTDEHPGMEATPEQRRS